MKVAIGSDHAGFKLKSFIIKHFKSKKINHIDYGTFSTDRIDYTDIAFEVAMAVSKNELDRGIIICGSGIGASIVANKVHGIRAARCENEYVARYSRLHNDSNVLALGERVIGFNLALSMIFVWLNTVFKGGRHQSRLDKIKEWENKI